jgi:rhamnosyltransferase
MSIAILARNVASFEHRKNKNPDMAALGALVILYHPNEAHLAALGALRHRCDALLVVDNTPQPDARAREVCARVGIALLHRGNRGGIAGAYNAGLAELFRERIDAVALFDQDSSIPDAYFPTMRKVCAELGSRAFLAGPRLFDDNVRSFVLGVWTDGFTLRRLRIKPDAMFQQCGYLIASGCLVSRVAFETLGPFNESLFIDHVDTDYCYRALSHKVPVYVVPALVLVHRIGAGQWHTLGPLKIASMNQPWRRCYYGARNAVWVGMRYGLRLPVALMPTLVVFWQIVKIVFFERDKRAKLCSTLLGFVDGLRGRLGSIEHTRPRFVTRMRRSP